MSIDDEILRAHGYSDWSTVNCDRLPVAVAFPKSTEEVSQIAKICFARNVPMSSLYHISSSGIERMQCTDNAFSSIFGWFKR